MMPERFTKNEVKYTDDHGTSSEQCSKCTHYLGKIRGAGVCEIVWGSINPEGWCNKFRRKP